MNVRQSYWVYIVGRAISSHVCSCRKAPCRIEGLWIDSQSRRPKWAIKLTIVHASDLTDAEENREANHDKARMVYIHPGHASGINTFIH